MTNRTPTPGFETFRPGGGHPPQRGPAPHQGRAPQRRPAPGRRPKRKRSSGLGSVLLFLGVGLAALLGAGVAILALAPPTDFIRDQIIAQVKSETGRDLRIDGATGLTFYPSLGFSMDRVSLSAPPEMGGAPLVAMKSMTVQVKLLPLLSRQVSVERFILDEPVFYLRVDAQGRRNWEFANFGGAGTRDGKIRLAQAAAGTASDAAAAAAGGTTGAGGGLDLAALESIELGDVRVIDGVLRYEDAASGSRESIEDIDLGLTLTSLADPFTATGNLTYKAERIDFEAVLTSLKKILGKEPATLEATFKSANVSGRYDGSIDVAGELKLDGKIDATSPSVKRLARWAGTELPPARGFGSFSLDSRLEAAGPKYTLTNAKIGLDGATATGTVTLLTSGARPKISGALQLSQLDVNLYLPPQGAEAEPAGAAASSSSSGGGTPEGSPQQGGPRSIDELLQRAPEVRGYESRNGWSDERIDFSGLGAVDTDLDLTVGSLLYEKIKVGRSRLKLELTDRSLVARLNELNLYEGTGKGVVTVNARAARPEIGANFNLSNVSARPLLTDAIDLDRLSGRGQVLMAVSTSGDNEIDLVSALNGTTSIAFTDGAVVGINVPKWVRALQQGRLQDLTTAPTEATDFSELKASFDIAGGVARNEDLVMLSPLLRVTGSGLVHLPERRIDYTARPKAVASLSGQGGERGASGLEIPVRIHGPFDNLKYEPDLGDVLKDPSKAVDAVREIGKQIGGEKAGQAIDKVLGGKTGKALNDILGGAKTEDGKIDAGKLLDGFLGGR